MNRLLFLSGFAAVAVFALNCVSPVHGQCSKKQGGGAGAAGGNAMFANKGFGGTGSGQGGGFSQGGGGMQIPFGQSGTMTSHGKHLGHHHHQTFFGLSGGTPTSFGQ